MIILLIFIGVSIATALGIFIATENAKTLIFVDYLDLLVFAVLPLDVMLVVDGQYWILIFVPFKIFSMYRVVRQLGIVLPIGDRVVNTVHTTINNKINWSIDKMGLNSKDQEKLRRYMEHFDGTLEMLDEPAEPKTPKSIWGGRPRRPKSLTDRERLNKLSVQYMNSDLCADDIRKDRARNKVKSKIKKNKVKTKSTTKINSDNATLVINDTTVIGDNNRITGNGNILKGDNLRVSGNNNIIKGDNCRVTGNNNTLKGDNGRMDGIGNSGKGDNLRVR